MDRGWAINIGGGFHHCSADHGGGFCVYADITLAIRFLFSQVESIKQAMIVDLDAHQVHVAYLSIFAATGEPQLASFQLVFFLRSPKLTNGRRYGTVVRVIKLHSIYPTVGSVAHSKNMSRYDSVLINKLSIGQSGLTHTFCVVMILSLIHI